MHGMRPELQQLADVKISAQLLARWAYACKQATVNNHVAWIQLEPEGFVITMIGPHGDRAELPFRWAELNAASSSLTPSTIDEIIRVLRRNLMVIRPGSLMATPIGNDGLLS